MLELRIQGRGGQGAQMAGEVLATTYFRQGFFVQAFSTYGGARRGSPVSSFIRVDERPIRLRCDVDEPDAIVCFDSSLLNPALLRGAGVDTVVLVNSSRQPEDFSDLVQFRTATLDGMSVAQANGLNGFVNSAVLGAFVRTMGSPDIDLLAEVVRRLSPAKVEENVQSLRDGYEQVKAGQG